MTAQNIMRSLVIAIILMAGIAQVQAVNYQTKYKGTRYNVQSTASFGVAAPAATFRSTSAFSSPEWAEQSATPMLNNDGSVDEGAYMSGRNNAPGGPRRIINPGEDDEQENGQPLGDAALPLMLCMCAYAIYKVSRRRKEA